MLSELCVSRRAEDVRLFPHRTDIEQSHKASSEQDETATLVETRDELQPPPFAGRVLLHSAFGGLRRLRLLRYLEQFWNARVYHYIVYIIYILYTIVWLLGVYSMTG